MITMLELYWKGRELIVNFALLLLPCVLSLLFYFAHSHAIQKFYKPDKFTSRVFNTRFAMP